MNGGTDRSRHGRLQQIVLAAMRMADEERAGFLDGACGGDADLRHEAERLLADRSGTDVFDAYADALRETGSRRSAWDVFLHQLRSRGPAYERYVFQGEIAHGGMGVVHRVFDQDARRTLALKLMLGQGDVGATGATPPVDDASLGRFLEEAQVTSQLDHPGIVPVHEIGVDGAGRVYFTMKLVVNLRRARVSTSAVAQLGRSTPEPRIAHPSPPIDSHVLDGRPRGHRVRDACRGRLRLMTNMSESPDLAPELPFDVVPPSRDQTSIPERAT